MSKYEEIITENVIECPYCSYEHVDHDYGESGDFVCDDCNMTFHLEACPIIQYVSIPDCELNNRTHKWNMHKFRDGSTHEFCKICDCIKSLDKNEDEND